ncbi:DUF7346 family protein [Halocatena marina]|uniref:Uncharacterized protein n=1 Tax=Halocatena marina TaxID=2934937 RepID=A0ABD5YN20_9EURY|nr:hypothetical protein [Halocatena marina]
MRTVRTDDGCRYLLIKRSSGSSLVRDPETGDERYIENEKLECTGVSSLETAAQAIAAPVRRIIRVASSDHALGVLIILDRRGPMAAVDLMECSDLCESDLNGLLTELRAAELIETVSIGGVPGYKTTEQASEGISALCD